MLKITANGALVAIFLIMISSTISATTVSAIDYNSAVKESFTAEDSQRIYQQKQLVNLLVTIIPAVIILCAIAKLLNKHKNLKSSKRTRSKKK